MKSLRIAALTSLFVSFCGLAVAQGTKSRAVDVSLEGKVFNVGSGFADSATLRVTSADGLNFRARGAFGGNQIFGRIDVPGITRKREADFTSVQFHGTLEVGGNDGSGLPAGTRTSFVMTLMLTGKGATGVFHVGKLLPKVDWEQDGTMTLSRVTAKP